MGNRQGDALGILLGADDDELARFRLLAISGASMTISVTVGFNSRFLTILNTCSNLAFSPFYHSVSRLPNAHKQAKG